MNQVLSHKGLLMYLIVFLNGNHLIEFNVICLSGMQLSSLGVVSNTATI